MYLARRVLKSLEGSIPAVDRRAGIVRRKEFLGHETSVFAFLLAALCVAAPAMAQGQQSGTLGGRLSSSDNLGLPGATVTVTSESLQGERTTVADINGVYSFPGLPPGTLHRHVRDGRHVERAANRARAARRRGDDGSGAERCAGH